MSGWLSAIFAGLAVVVSVWTWYAQRRMRVRAERRAHVTVSFHWLTALAQVQLSDGRTLGAGYHIVLANNGPAPARNVQLELVDAAGRALTLLDVGIGEFPLALLDVGGRYPIPWLYAPFDRQARRFIATISWEDAAGPQERTVPLRRGQLPS